jgi:hypothetical protein
LFNLALSQPIDYTFLSHSIMWSLSYFFVYTYLIFIMSVLLYLISNLKDYVNTPSLKNFSNFSFLTGFDLAPLLFTPLILILYVLFTWVSPVVTGWFGHLTFTPFQFKVNFILITFFYLILIAYVSTFYYSSQEVYDFMIVVYNFYLWIMLLFLSNNLFTFIFFMEILSAIITLLLVSSVFSSVYFYNNLSLTLNNYFNTTTPFAFLQTLVFFFWISLIASLNLFVFLILLYLKFLTFDWFLLESIFSYVIASGNIKGIFYIALGWTNFLFCIFLKCGVVPFYFWKPIFFKGVPLHALLFYIVFYYFTVILFFLHFFIVYLNDLFYFNTAVNLIILVIGLIFLMFIVLESYYVKSFLAISSIINTVFVFLAMTGFNITDFSLFL